MTMQPHPPGGIDAEIVLPNVSVARSTWVWEATRPQEDYIDADYLIFLLPSSTMGAHVRVGNSDTLGPPVNTGVVSFWPAGARFRTDGSLGKLVNVRCAFHGSWFRGMTGLDHHLTPEAIQTNLDLKNASITSLMQRLASEIESPCLGVETMVEGLGLQLAAELARHLQQKELERQVGAPTLTPWQIKRVRRYFENFDGYMPDPCTLADLCGISPRHFRRLFKDTTGQTLSDYARAIWVDRAKRLLSEPDVEIKLAGAQLGFSSGNRFTMAFKSATGTTPTEYRRRVAGSHPLPARDHVPAERQLPAEA